MASGSPQNTSQDGTELSESQSTQSKKAQPKTVKAGFSKKKKMTPKEQSVQFVKTARELGNDEGEQKFEEIMSKVLKSNGA